MKRAPKSATKFVVLENSDPISAETEAIQSRIRQRAFELSQTHPHDARDFHDWLSAELEVLSVPPAEIIEKGGTFEVRFAVAGVNPGDVNIMVTPEQIALKSEYSHGHDADVGTVHLCEFKSATVFRSVNLPQTIDTKSVKVDFKDGMVRVSAVKEGAAPARPKRVAPRARKAAAKKSRGKMP